MGSEAVNSCTVPLPSSLRPLHSLLTMPFLTLMTNLKASSLPASLMPKLVAVVAPLMSKPVPAFNWILDTDKTMSKGPDNAASPYILLKIEAISIFQGPENVKMITPKIFQFFAEEANIEKEHLIVTFHNLEATHASVLGKTVAELRA